MNGQKNEVKTIAVYASSSEAIAPVYFDAAKELGILLAQRNIRCINGAGYKGLMATLTDSMLANGGRVTGVIPRFMVDKGWKHPQLNEVIVTKGMHERKQWMAQHSDACIALPGGLGTLDELFEIIAWKQLDLYSGTVVILNINHYYDPLLMLLKQGQKEQFIPGTSVLWQVAETVQEAIVLAATYPDVQE
ncbi:MAG: TIGR00730 family Rossman fold protein [Dysgonamonadaceae bacterium]|jgi:uncharacterized protein (TIGR00730 family)|nr:TIGR00730 family Rossman fold protein [Dysgonamonadaceae bacterium]